MIYVSKMIVFVYCVDHALKYGRIHDWALLNCQMKYSGV